MEAEEVLKHTTYELGERVKELNCLYGISHLIERSGSSLDEILQGVVDLIPLGWQYPAITCARILLYGREFKTKNCGDALWKQSADIVVLGDRIGWMEVGYAKGTPESDEGPFLKQERDLLTAIAERLGRVAERMKAEEELRESEERYRGLVERAPVGILSIEKEGRIREVNQKLLDILGSPSPEATKSINMLTFPPLVKSGLSQAFRRCMETGQEVKAEIPYTSRWGKTSHLRTILTPWLDLNGNVMGCQAVAEDITERKRAEEERESLRRQILQAQKMEAIGTLTGGIAHDFNNLLTIMNGYAQLILSETTEDDPIYSDLQKIVETGFKGADLVKRLQAFSKKAEISVQPLNLNVIVDNLVSLMGRTFPKNIEIVTVFETNLSMINADALNVEQVLINLCINAKEAMPGGGRLRIETRNAFVDEEHCRVHPGAKPGQHVLIEISDTGTGMSKDTTERMFDPFFSTKGWDFNKGTGLGLSVARGIVEQHGGWMTCESEPGKGTSFRIYFPAMVEASVAEKPVPAVESFPSSEKILLVDDEEYVRGLGKRLLERAGYTVITAVDGKEALEIYAREQSNIGLVVLDLIMPQMGGEKCLEELLKINPQVKVVVSSGHSLDARERLILGALAKGFVSKPYEMKQLVQTVEGLL